MPLIPALLLSGRTYPVRRELRSAGGVWNYEKTGYVFREQDIDQVERLAYAHNLRIDHITIDPIVFEPLEGERLWAYQREKANRKAHAKRRRNCELQ